MPVPRLTQTASHAGEASYIMADGEVPSDRRTHNVGLLLREIAHEEERRQHPLPAAPVRRVAHKRIYNIRVRGLARPTPDYDKLARAVLDHARNEAEKADSSNQGADAA